MKIKDLIEKLKTYNPEDKIYVSGDPEGNDIRTIDEIYLTEIPKSNNVGTFDAIVIYPTDNIINLNGLDTEEE